MVVNLLGSWAPGKIATTSDDLWHGQLATNLHAVFYVLREAVPRMSDGGAIVNVANALPVEGRGGQLAYAVAKGAVITLTQSLALELKPRAIRVNAILPRNIDTPGNRALQPHADPQRVAFRRRRGPSASVPLFRQGRGGVGRARARVWRVVGSPQISPGED